MTGARGSHLGTGSGPGARPTPPSASATGIGAGADDPFHRGRHDDRSDRPGQPGRHRPLHPAAHSMLGDLDLRAGAPARARRTRSEPASTGRRSHGPSSSRWPRTPSTRSWHRRCGPRPRARPAALAYRAVNTMDAMVGHHSDRHERFGWASARLDDLANWVPARATVALAMAARPAAGCDDRPHGRRDAPAHPSPNAGAGRSRVRRGAGRPPRRHQRLRRTDRATGHPRGRQARKPAHRARRRASWTTSPCLLGTAAGRRARRCRPSTITIDGGPSSMTDPLHDRRSTRSTRSSSTSAAPSVYGGPAGHDPDRRARRGALPGASATSRPWPR